MKLYDSVIEEWGELLSSSDVRRLSVRDADWPDCGNDNMIFAKDMAFELGGERRFSESSFTVTEAEELVPEDEILLIGPDINEIKSDIPFSRLTVVRVDKDSLPDGDRLHGAIEKIGLTKYHVSPKGYMLRISSGKGVESARVSRDAVNNGLNFETVGNMYRAAYHKYPEVKAVRTVFITDEKFDFEKLKEKIKKADEITKAIDHIYQKMSVMDCGSCHLQKICNEVEGLKELHFGQTK